MKNYRSYFDEPVMVVSAGFKRSLSIWKFLAYASTIGWVATIISIIIKQFL